MSVINLFASRINAQVPNMHHGRPDPQAIAVDAFAMQWGGTFMYAFDPFSVIPWMLQKIRQDFAHVLAVLPI